MTNEYLQKIVLNPNSSREEYMFAYMILQQRTQQQDYYNQLTVKTSNV